MAPLVKNGQWVRYNDERGADHDALVERDHGAGVLDVVIVIAEKVLHKMSVPHRSLLLREETEMVKTKNRKGKVTEETRTVIRRAAGAYWTD